ncbi:MAG: right-handed parallel beta-helix repeat-containing protein [Candidatus Binatia bacterium]|nr:right-handed parallel beta-helix repeat-containing protein [Candidatus Binatia bacterium]
MANLEAAVDIATGGKVICISDATDEPPAATALCPDGTTSPPAHVTVNEIDFGAPFDANASTGLLITGCNTARVRPGAAGPFDTLVYVCPSSGNVIFRDLRIGETGDQIGFLSDNAGTDVSEESGTVLKSVRLSNNSVGALIRANKTVITGSTAESNGVGFQLQSDLNRLRSNRALDNVQHGFQIEGGQNQVRNNSAANNGGAGFYFATSEGNEIRGNRASANTDSGFWFDPASGSNEIQGNQAERNRESGFEVASASNLLVSNRAKRNDDSGFLVQGDGNDFEKNKAEANAASGYTIQGNDNQSQRDDAKNNNQSGFEVSGGENTLYRGESRCNRGDGLLVQDPGAGRANFISRYKSCGNAVDVTAYEYDVAANNLGDGRNRACNSPASLPGQIARQAKRSCFRGGTGSDGNTGGNGGGSGASGDNKPPRCNMKADPRKGPAPLLVEFRNTTSDPDGSFEDLTFRWDFGDGSPPSSEVSPVHTYASVGKFDVTLIATDPDGGTCTKTFRGKIRTLEP